MTWRTRADELGRFAPAAAEAFRAAADELEAALATAEDEALDLTTASLESGYAARTLREHIARGKVPNAGSKHRPRIRRGDLPRRTRSAPGAWDAESHVSEIVR